MKLPPPPPGSRLEIVMFSGDRIEFGRYELARALFHRYVVIHYVLVCFFLTLVNTRSGLPPMRMNEQAIIVVFSVFTAVMLLVGVILALDQIAQRRGRLVVPASPFLMVAAVCGVLAGDVTEMILVDGSVQRWFRTAALAIFYYILVEAVAHLVVLVVIPRVLRDVRVPAPMAVDEAIPAAQDMSAPEEVPDHIEIGGRRIKLEALVRITAEGNYLRVVTSQERMFLPGPFSAAVEGLPEKLGVQLSRSEWVAAAVVRGIWKDGREMYVDLQDGTTVRVANSRQKVVTSLLELPVQRGKMEAAGQGTESATSIQSG